MALKKKAQMDQSIIDLFKFDQLKPEYLAIHPDGWFPRLVHNGQPVRNRPS